MSDKFIEDILNHAEGEDLAHYGTLGMRWGVRKDKKGYSKLVKVSDSIEVAPTVTDGVTNGFYMLGDNDIDVDLRLKSSAKMIKAGIKKLNADPYYQVDLNDPKNLKIKDDYEERVVILVDNIAGAEETWQKVRRAEIKANIVEGLLASVAIVTVAATLGAIPLTHSETELFEIEYPLLRDNNGLIVDVGVPKVRVGQPIKHSEEELEDYLAHWGILGMRWGVRKDNRGRKTGKPISGTEAATREGTSKSRPRVQTSIDVANTPKEDAAELTDEERGRAAVEMAINSGLDVVDVKEITPDGVTLRVSRPMTDNELRDEINGARLDREYQTLFDENQAKNSELRTTIERIKMEREYAALTAPKKSAANQFVRDIVLTSVKTAGTALLTTALKRAGGKAMGNIFKARDVKVEGDIKSAIKESVVDAKDRKMAERILKESTARADLRISRAADVKTATRSAIDLLPDRAFRPRVDTPVPLTSFRGQQIDQIIKELKS